MSVRLELIINEMILDYPQKRYINQDLAEAKVVWEKERPTLETMVQGVAPLGSASEFDITFCNVEKVESARESINKSKSRMIICYKEIAEVLSEEFKGKMLMCLASSTQNPKMTFMKIISIFFLPPRELGISPTAIIGKHFNVGKDACIGHYVVIGRNVTIGDHVTIHDGVKIVDNCVIGDNVTIFANTVIGADGFGYQFDADKVPVKFPHLGSVSIGNNVEIGANTCIDRGTLSDTIIEDDVKIDNLCHIAHNVHIGKNSFIIALSMVAGSVKIGENVWVSPCSSILNQIKIGDQAMIGMGAVVFKDIPPNTTVVGNPARVLKTPRGGSNLKNSNQSVKEK